MRRTLSYLFAAMVTIFMAGHTIAQTYPAKPIRLQVGFPPGGGSDTSARVVAAAMEKRLGQPIIVENRPGAGSLIAVQYVARSEPDGYTILFGTASGVHPVFMKEGIDVTKEFLPISNLQVGGLILATKAGFPANTIQDLVRWSKANPGKLNFGAIGIQGDLYMQVVKARTGLEYASIPYKGDAPIVTALLGGEVEFALSNILAVLPHIQAGKMGALLITRKQRSSMAPTIPTAAELGIPDVLWEFNLGLWAPKGTPRPVIQRLSTEAIAAARLPEIVEQFRKFGADAVGSTPEEQLRTLEDEIKFWSEAARLANFKPQ